MWHLGYTLGSSLGFLWNQWIWEWLYGIHIAEYISTPLKLACGVFAFGFDCSLDLHKCRLCQELVLQKAPLAELVFPHVLGNLAARFESSSEFCRKFSEQVGCGIVLRSLCEGVLPPCCVDYHLPDHGHHLDAGLVRLRSMCLEREIIAHGQFSCFWEQWIAYAVATSLPTWITHQQHHQEVEIQRYSEFRWWRGGQWFCGLFFEIKCWKNHCSRAFCTNTLNHATMDASNLFCTFSFFFELWAEGCSMWTIGNEAETFLQGEKSLGNGGETGTGSARKRRSDHGDAEKGGSEPGNQHHWIRSSWQKVVNLVIKLPVHVLPAFLL